MPRSTFDPDAAPVVPWEEFLPWFGRSWRQGEHVSLIGPTQQGKTTFGLRLLPFRRNVVVVATKPRDPTLTPLVRGARRQREFRLIRSWSERNMVDRRLLLWPHYRGKGDQSGQAAAIGDAFGSIFAAGSWTVFGDEISYLVRRLKLERDLLDFWQQGAGMGITFVGATQRPAWVPPDLYSAPTHLFFWRTNDDNDLRRISGMNGVASTTVRTLVGTLDRHQALYVNTREGTMFRTTAKLER